MRRQKKYFLLAFIEGASVMAVELGGAKIASVYYGNSLYVWSSIISIAVAGLAAGYFLGGILSEKYPGERTIYYLFFAAALAVVTMPAWANIIMKMAMVLGYQIGALVSCFFFLFPAMVCHGAVSPVLIRFLTRQLQETGKTAGYVYAVSTTGGILMTFFTGFFMIPEWGLRASVYSMAAVLGAIPMFYFLNKKIIISVAIMFLFPMLIFFGMTPQKQKKNSHIRVLHRSEGLLGQVSVADDLQTEKRSLLINNISQTFMHIPSGRSQWRYVHRVALFSSIKPAGSKVLVCGLGGGNVINELAELGFQIDAVELDGRMEKIAKKYFRLNSGSRIFTDDARHYIRTTHNKYDIIVLDMSAGENQPSNVYTIECFREIRKILNSGALLIVHYQNVIEGDGAVAVKSLGKTLLAAGFHTKLINTEKILADFKKNKWDQIGELMLFSTLEPVDLSNYGFERRNLFADPFHFPRGKLLFIDDYDFSGGELLTDNNPIMDVMHLNALQATRQATLDQLIPILIKEKIDVF